MQSDKDTAIRVQIYASTANVGFADKMALALHNAGHEIVNGEFDPATSDAVVVLWSGVSIGSAKLIEATRAPLAAGALVPVSIGRIEPPEDFKHLAPMDLAGWSGDPDDPRWRFVVDEIKRIASSEAVAENGAPAADINLYAEGANSEVAAEEPAPEAPAPVFSASVSGTTGARFAPPSAVVFGLALIGAVLFGGFVALVAGRSDEDKDAQPSIAQTAPLTPRSEVSEAAATAIAEIPESASVIAPIQTAERPVAEEVVEPPGNDAVEEDVSDAASEEVAPDTDPNTDTGRDEIAELIAAAGGDEEDDASAEGAPPVVGEVFKDCPACPQMTTAPPGRFNFGSPVGERSRLPAEGPVVEVTIPTAFAIGVYEVTYAEWDACVAAGACNKYTPPAGWGRGRQPLVNVSWNDAQSYVAWLSEKTGKAYRLPSEAEWEYAARAGGETPFSFGGVVAPTQANFDGTLPYGAARGANRRRPSPVGSFAANAFGLFDMHGNVWEWTADCWGATHQGAPTDGSAITGNCSAHVLKGGAWNTGGWRLRAGHRIGKNANAREYDNGFRVARDLN